MTFDNENMDHQIEILLYEAPSIKKYGSMKEMTLGTGGSGGDGMGSDPRSNLKDRGPITFETQPRFNTEIGDLRSPDTSEIDESPRSTIRDGIEDTGNAFD